MASIARYSAVVSALLRMMFAGARAPHDVGLLSCDRHSRLTCGNSALASGVMSLATSTGGLEEPAPLTSIAAQARQAVGLGQRLGALTSTVMCDAGA